MQHSYEREKGFEPWYVRHPHLRRYCHWFLKAIDPEYRTWKNAQLSRKQKIEYRKKIRRQLIHRRWNMVGRGKEYDRLIHATFFHVLKDKKTLETTKLPPAKIFFFRGDTGTGKSLMAKILTREVFELGLNENLFVRPIIVKASDVFSKWYGESSAKLSNILQDAMKSPAILFIDEFDAFSQKKDVGSSSSREDTKVESAILTYFDEIVDSDCSLLVACATKNMERVRSDIRRRGEIVDFDEGITPEMLLGITKNTLVGFNIDLDHRKVFFELERNATEIGVNLTPSDIVSVIQLVTTRWSMKARKDPTEQKLGIKEFRDVKKHLRRHVQAELSEEVASTIMRVRPKTRLEDVGGLFGIKEKIFKIVSLALDRELSIAAGYTPPRGFLLYGPPGTGKTLIVKALCGTFQVPFFTVNAAQLMSKWAGEGEKNIRHLFEIARREGSAIIFFDEFDAIARKRGTSVSEVGDKIVNQILTELDGMTPNEGVIVFASTNRMDIIDPAVLSRFKPYIVEIPYPRDDTERISILEKHLQHFVDLLGPEVSPRKILYLFGNRTMSGRDIDKLVGEANRIRIQELFAGHRYIKQLKFGEGFQAEISMDLFEDDLRRLFSNLNIDQKDNSLDLDVSFLEILLDSYPLRLIHFAEAIDQIKDKKIDELRSYQDFVLPKKPTVGKVCGLAAVMEGQEGIVGVVECHVKKGTGKTVVTGSVRESIIESIENVKAYLTWKYGIDFSTKDIFMELVTPLEGVDYEEHKTSGPSAGVTFAIALISALLGIPVKSDVAMTGKITIRGEVGPVGGLDFRGSGKLVAALERNLRMVIIPQTNYMRLEKDELARIEEKKISVVGVSHLEEIFPIAFGAIDLPVKLEEFSLLSGEETPSPKPLTKVSQPKIISSRQKEEPIISIDADTEASTP